MSPLYLSDWKFLSFVSDPWPWRHDEGAEQSVPKGSLEEEAITPFQAQHCAI